MHRFVLAFCVGIGFAASAVAGEYRIRGVYGNAYPVVHAPQFFYFVGQPVRIAALVEAEKRTDPDYRLFLQFKQLRGEFEAFRKNETGAPPANETQPEERAPSAAIVVARRCAACHSGAAPEGGLRLDGLSRLSASQVTAAQRRVLRGEMPPAESLSPDEVGQVLQELLTLERSNP